MFAKGDKQKDKKQNIGAHAISMLSEGCAFRGKMLLRGEVRLGGAVEGEIVSEHDLIIERSADIRANIDGHNIQVCGSVCGNINARGILILAPSSNVSGNITTTNLIVENGAILHGNVAIDELEPSSETIRDDAGKSNGAKVTRAAS
ncbi:MAG: polymer-forming cytoskeletal protein [Burkholderiales bacterium]|nr:MAG: polymer-forming cytoskeletal protein [Burkholderiales bacterium]